eukprot:316661-Chlamydomonas_euryale.AAC.4
MVSGVEIPGGPGDDRAWCCGSDGPGEDGEWRNRAESCGGGYMARQRAGCSGGGTALARPSAGPATEEEPLATMKVWRLASFPIVHSPCRPGPCFV